MTAPTPPPLSARVEQHLPRVGPWLVALTFAVVMLAALVGRPLGYLAGALAVTLSTVAHVIVLNGRVAPDRGPPGRIRGRPAAAFPRGQGPAGGLVSKIRRVGGPPPPYRSEQELDTGAALTRSIRYMRAGVALAGATTVVAFAVSMMDPGDPPASSVAAGGLIASAITVAFGLLLLLPGVADSAVARARRALEGISAGLCLAAARAMVLPLVPVGPGTMRTVALIVTAVLWTTLPLCGLVALRSRPGQRAAAWGAAGAACLSIGLSLLAYALGSYAPRIALAAACTALVAGPVLIWRGTRQAADGDAARRPVDATTVLSGHPLLLAPTAIAVVAAGYHWTAFHTFEPVVMTVAMLAMGAVSIREMLAALDVRRYARQLAAQSAHFRGIVAGSSDVTVLLDEHLAVVWLSPAAERQFALADRTTVGTAFTDRIHPEDVGELRERLNTLLARSDPAGTTHPVLVEARLLDGFGRWRDTESTVSDQRAVPEVGALVVHLRDVGERKELERTLHRLTFTDQLTGLANRRELLRTVAALRSVPNQCGAVVILDLDGFAAVNDVKGHEVGDAVLVEVARRLRGAVGDADLPARLGSDEFAVLTPTTPVQAYALATRLLATIAEGCELPGGAVRLSAGVGMADISCPGGVDEVLRRADLALRRAKQSGRSRVEWYDETVEAAMGRRMTLEEELPGAVGREEMDLLYQPIVELGSGRPVAVEALLRWRHPRLGTVAPGEFVPVAEALGLIDEIGEWVLGRACRQLASWRREGAELWMTVNVSARQLSGPGFVATAAHALAEHGVPAEHLVIEVPEPDIGTQASTRVVNQLAGLRALGVRTALDRFGTGPTSLAHLRRLPIDLLKIDHALFTGPPGHGGAAGPIIDVVAGLGRRLGLEIIAAGVELAAHLDAVRDSGCRYGQGYLFARPSPAERVEAYLEHHRSPMF